MACSGCQEMLYCSVACQADDAPIHKFICCLPASTTPPPSSDPPTEEDGKHVLGVLFPETSANPTLVWVRIGGFADEESGISFQEPEITPLFPGDNVTLESIHSERNRTRNRDTKSMLEVWHANKSASASASQGGENLCISALAAAGTTKQPQDSGPFYEWKGPVLVLFMTRSTGFMVDPGSYQDCQVHDFRDAVDFVLDYGNDAHHAKKIREATGGDGFACKARSSRLEHGKDDKDQCLQRKRDETNTLRVGSKVNGIPYLDIGKSQNTEKRQNTGNPVTNKYPVHLQVTDAEVFAGRQKRDDGDGKTARRMSGKQNTEELRSIVYPVLINSAPEPFLPGKVGNEIDQLHIAGDAEPEDPS
ncbi:hypothetical protein B0H66DRAFT_606554 [Apodospora peruviana]|uniref:MYND-type domain-containing protein n=1 Tax=Apodospora peruviana TaxID=516989 RepID=A0AAE0HV30_9PEZI|nr:hypothetical protein B0H66DRAFT_606554 [Apodospora peruviana]